MGAKPALSPLPPQQALSLVEGLFTGHIRRTQSFSVTQVRQTPKAELGVLQNGSNSLAAAKS